jgi:hypothetical protein
MTHITSKAVFSLFSLVLLCTLARGQDIPAVTTAPAYSGFQLPSIPGNLTYGLNGSERFRSGHYGNGDNVWSTSLSGQVGYLSRSVARPFSLVYSGGYIYNSSGTQSSIFQNLALSQTFITQTWSIVLTDSIKYLPDAPSSGISGVPGVGDVGVTPPAGGTDTGQEILSDNSQRIANSASGTVSKQLTGSTAAQVEGGYVIQRFTGEADGIDTDNVTAQAGLSHRFSARTTVNGSYGYTDFVYVGENDSFITQQIQAGLTRQATRRLSFQVSAGPQIVTSNIPLQGGTSLNFSGNGSASYQTHHYDFGLNAFRGVRSGSGIVQGALTDSVGGSAGRLVGEYLHLSASGGYTHSSSVQVLTSSPYSINTYVFNLQASRQVTTNLSAFVSYGFRDQSSSNPSATLDAFTGSNQLAAFGISYSPRPIHLGHQ